MALPNWLVNPFRLMAQNRALQDLLDSTRDYAESERRVLIDEIERRKHMSGVQMKLFAGLGVFENMLRLVRASLANLMTTTTQNTKYAIVAEIEAVKVTHLLFKMSLFQRFIQSSNPCRPGDSTCAVQTLPPLPTYKESEFGRWYYGAGQVLAQHDIFQSIETPLRNMHIFAEEALDLFNEGHHLMGVDKVTEMEQASMEILKSLESLAVSLFDEARRESEAEAAAASAANESGPSGQPGNGFNSTDPATGVADGSTALEVALESYGLNSGLGVGAEPAQAPAATGIGSMPFPKAAPAIDPAKLQQQQESAPCPSPKLPLQSTQPSCRAPTPISSPVSRQAAKTRRASTGSESKPESDHVKRRYYGRVNNKGEIVLLETWAVSEAKARFNLAAQLARKLDVSIANMMYRLKPLADHVEVSLIPFTL